MIDLEDAEIAGKRVSFELCPQAEAVEDRQGRPLDRLCRGTQGLIRGVDEAKHAQRRVRQRREAVGQARSFGVVAVFVPPAILEEVQAV